MVSIKKCPTYDLLEIKKKICESLHEIEFDLSQLKNKRVGIKPNLLTVATPEMGVITHPFLLQAVVQIIKEQKGTPVLIENPAFMSLQSVLIKTDFNNLIVEENIEVAHVEETKNVKYEQARIYKEFPISKEFFNVDVIVTLPKLKTHGITYFTGAVKNLFGAIPGLEKSKYHLKAKQKNEFSELILDLYMCMMKGIKQDLSYVHIMDAIICLEGEGPGKSGTPRTVGAILASRDALALDYAACKLVGLDYNNVLTLTSGIKRNIGITSFENVKFSGDSIDDFTIANFKPSGGTLPKSILNRLIENKIMRSLFIEKPVPLSSLCTLCYQCKKICPALAIDHVINKKVPVFDYNTCIRCFCCMEICPEGAIFAKNGLFQKIIKI